jgi:hypothetical protein
MGQTMGQIIYPLRTELGALLLGELVSVADENVHL